RQRAGVGAGVDVGDRLVDVDRGGVVVPGREGLVDTAGLAPLLAQAVGGLRARGLLEELGGDVEQIRVAGLPAADHVSRPHLLREGPRHVDPSLHPSWGCVLMRRRTRSRALHSSWAGPRSDALASHSIRRQYRSMDNTPEENGSGVGVLDKAAVVLGALEAGPATLAQLVQSTGLPRPTAHRLAVALEYHHLVARDMQGRFILGPRLGELAAAAGED